MSRELVLKLGAIAWTVFAIDMLIHIVNGEWITAAIVVTVGAVWIAFRQMQRHMPKAAETTRH